MSEINLILPYPPTVNHYKRIGRTIITKRGKILQTRVNTDATKRFYYEVWLKVRVACLKSLGEALVSLEIDVYPPDKRKRDLDGILKVLLDSLQKANLFDDDAQISRLLVTRCSIIPQGKIVVRLKSYVHV